MKTNHLIILILSLSINLFGNENYYSPEAFNNNISSEDLILKDLHTDFNTNVSDDFVSIMIDSAKSKVINSPIVSILNNDDVLNTYVEWKLLNPENSPINSQIENDKNILSITVGGETMHFGKGRFQLLKTLSMLHGIRSSDSTSYLTVHLGWSTRKGNRNWILVYKKHFE